MRVVNNVSLAAVATIRIRLGMHLTSSKAATSGRHGGLIDEGQAPGLRQRILSNLGHGVHAAIVE